MNNMLSMDEKKTLNEVRKFFENDKFATENGAVIDEIGDYTATCSLKITDSHRNAMGAVMGGVYFMLADFAFAVAAITSIRSASSSIDLLSWYSASSSLSF